MPQDAFSKQTLGCFKGKSEIMQLFFLSVESTGAVYHFQSLVVCHKFIIDYIICLCLLQIFGNTTFEIHLHWHLAACVSKQNAR